jgi:hypothetical protein
VVAFGGALVAAVRDFVTTGDGAEDDGTAGWLEADACDEEVVPPTAVGLRTVVVVGGGFGLATAMITTMATAAVMMLRRRTDQSGRDQSRTRPTGKQMMSSSTTEAVRRYQGCVGCARDRVARYGEMTNSSSAIHSCQPDGGCGQDGSGSHPGGGDQPAGG